MSFGAKFKVNGTSALIQRLRLVRESMANKWLRRGVTKGTRIVRRAAKENLKKATGTIGRERTHLLEESLSVKISVKGKQKIVGLVGHKRGFKKLVGERKRDGKKSKKGDPIYEDPANIAHLVEKGHAGPHPAPPHPYLVPAAESSAGEVQTAIVGELQVGIAQSGRGK